MSYVFGIIGAVLITLSIYIWIQDVSISKIDSAINDNKLVITRIYSWIRNPICSAIDIVMTDTSLLFLISWILALPLLLAPYNSNDESSREKWLFRTYGDEYADYCKKVNRYILWLPKRKS